MDDCPIPHTSHTTIALCKQSPEHLLPTHSTTTLAPQLCITLDGIFESEFIAELLTSKNLSELAILTLYLMYEKKTGQDSFWAPYIQVRGRVPYIQVWEEDTVHPGVGGHSGRPLPEVILLSPRPLPWP